MKNLATLLVLAIMASGVMLMPGMRHANAQELNSRHYFEVTTTDAENAIAQALVAEGAGPKISTNMMTSAKTLYDYHHPMKVEVKTLKYDEGKNQWSANLYFLSDGEVISAMPATGYYQVLSSLPVLHNTIRYGQVINASDIDWRDYPVNRLRRETVTDPDLLIGKTAKRTISANRPIRVSELAEPAILEKDALIKMVYRSNNMEITTSGIALDAGAKGDVISVRNLNSNKIVHAVVTAPNTAIVAPSGIASSQLAERNNHGFN